MKRIPRFITRYSTFIIISVILITIFMGYFATKIKIKAGIEEMFPDSNPTVHRFNQANEQFGGMSFAILMIEDENILDSSTLEKIKALTQELKNVNGVNKIVSLTNVDQIKGSPFGIETSLLVNKIPGTPAEEEKLRQIIIQDDLYTGSLISENFKATGIMVVFEKNIEPADTMEPVSQLKSIAKKYIGPEKIYFTGNPVVVYDAQQSMKEDILKLLPFVLIIFILILWFSFRSLWGVLLPLATVLISIIWSVGGLALLNKPLSIISVALPVLLVSVGSAYAIHIITRLQEELAKDVQPAKAIMTTIKNVGIAVLIAGITTMIGFGSLLFSDLVIIQEFALSTAFGIGVALLISIFFIPAIFTHLPLRFVKNQKHTAHNRFLSNLFEMAFNLVSTKKHFIFITIMILIIISLAGIPRLYPETGYLNYFKANSPTREAATLVDQHFGGSATLDIIIRGDIHNPELLAQMATFQDQAAQIEGLNNPISIVTLLRAVNQALHGDDPAMKVIPTTRQQIAQYLLLLNMSGQENTQEYLTFDNQTSRIQFLMESLPGREIQQILVQIDQLLSTHFPHDQQIEVTGIPVLNEEISNLLIRSQIKSIIASILLTLITTTILLKSIKGGLFCSSTILLTVLLNFGIMSWFNIPLDIATTMIASIAVGIGIDYSIHIYSRYQEELKESVNPQAALQKTIQHVGRANLYNAFAVVAGFCVILFSSFPPLVNFGGLTSLTMIISFLSSLFLLPALLLLQQKHSKEELT